MEKNKCEQIQKEFKELIAIKEEFDKAYTEAIQSGSTRDALEIKEQLEFRQADLWEKVDTIHLRDQLAKKFGYEFVGEFYDGWAVAHKSISEHGTESYWIDKHGRRMSGFDEYNYAETFSEGHGWCTSLKVPPGENPRRALVNKAGKIVWSGNIFGATFPMKGNATRVMNSESEYKFIYTNGKESSNWENAEDYSEGFAAVKENNRWGFIDKTGEPIFDKYTSVSSFHEGLAAVQKNSGWSYIDREGHEITGVFLTADDFSEGVACVSVRGQRGVVYYFINKDGERISDDEYEYALSFSEGKAVVQKEGKVYFIDRQGNKLFNKEFASAQAFREGIALVDEADGQGSKYINSEGEFITNETFLMTNSFHDGVAVVQRQDGKTYLLNKQGKLFPDGGTNSIPDQVGGGVFRIISEGGIYYIDNRGRRVFE